MGRSEPNQKTKPDSSIENLLCSENDSYRSRRHKLEHYWQSNPLLPDILGSAKRIPGLRHQ